MVLLNVKKKNIANSFGIKNPSKCEAKKPVDYFFKGGRGVELGATENKSQ